MSTVHCIAYRIQQYLKPVNLAGASTNSIVMRASSGTVRVIETQHRWEAPVTPGAIDPSRLQFQQRGVATLGARIVR